MMTQYKIFARSKRAKPRIVMIVYAKDLIEAAKKASDALEEHELKQGWWLCGAQEVE